MGINHNQKAEAIFTNLFREDWMCQLEWRKFKERVLKICGYSPQRLANDLLSKVSLAHEIDAKLEEIKAKVK